MVVEAIKRKANTHNPREKPEPRDLGSIGGGALL